MADVGELIIEAWLKEIKGCEFVEYGVKTQNQGEIDVVGLSLQNKHAYLCESASHIHGLWYANDTDDQTVKLVTKFKRTADWAKDYLGAFPDRTYMLWTPVLKSNTGSKRDSAKSVEDATACIKKSHGIDLEVVKNSDYRKKLQELREKACETTSNFSSSVLRLMQIEEWNKKQLK